MADDDVSEEATRPRRRRRSVGTAIGGIIAGVDAQVVRATRPPAELVEAARPVRGLSGPDGTRLTIDLPEDPPADEPPRPVAWPPGME
jgi:hypothetical protein